MAQTHIAALLDLDRREPGAWALAQGENSFLLKSGVIKEGNGAYIELHRAIPVPSAEVPLAEVLEFKQRRHNELQALRAELDGLVAAINSAENKDAELAKHVAHVDAACADALKAGKEWRFPFRLASLKLSLDLRPFTSIAAGLVGWEAGKAFGLPTATALLFGAAASFKIGGDFGTQSIRPRLGPYRYVYQFHQEVL